jgi:hypothetical protein
MVDLRYRSSFPDVLFWTSSVWPLLRYDFGWGDLEVAVLDRHQNEVTFFDLQPGGEPPYAEAIAGNHPDCFLHDDRSGDLVDKD